MGLRLLQLLQPLLPLLLLLVKGLLAVEGRLPEAELGVQNLMELDWLIVHLKQQRFKFPPRAELQE